MARGRRRGGGGGRGRVDRFSPASARTDMAAGMLYLASQLGMCSSSMGRPSSEHTEVMKRVIASSDVADPVAMMRMWDNMKEDGSGSSHSSDMKDLGPLHEAAGTGRMDTCKYLVEQLGFDINADANDDSGMAPLACAVLHGKAIAVRYLIGKGADLDKQDNTGFTPVHYATKEGKDGLARLLLSKGASVDISSCEGTPLHVAASYGKPDIMQILLQHNADPNKVSADLGTPMAAALCVACGRISEAVALKCMKLLVKAGADLNCTNPDTPLVIATSRNLYECVEYLLEVGADANIPINYGGETPIEIAANSGNRKLVEILFPFTSTVPSVSNWSVEGIIAHTKSPHLNRMGRQSEEKTTKKEVVGASKSNAEDKGGDNDEKAQLKLLGAKAVKGKDYAGASKFYSEAIKVDPEDATLYSNRSLCHLKSGEAQDALIDANSCIRLRPVWPKGYYRKGAACMSLKDYKEACDAFMAGVKLDPASEEMHDAFWEAVEAMKVEHSARQGATSSDSD